MRQRFIDTLSQIASNDPRIYLIVGDLGFGVVDGFAEKFPDRFFNCGVAEQNMMGMAAGLALSGKIVFAYSICNFVTFRCLEQIRNDICYHRAAVNIVGVGAGYTYGALGMSHHATEDVAVMRAIPNMTVVNPGDTIETEGAIRQMVDSPGPHYLRIGRGPESPIHASGTVIKVGSAIKAREGSDITLVATGAILGIAVQVADHLAQNGVESRVLSMHTVSPLDEKAIREAATETRAVITLEEHSIIGGLGSAVAEILCEMEDFKGIFKRIGLPRDFCNSCGGHARLLQDSGISKNEILGSLKPLIQKL